MVPKGKRSSTYGSRHGGRVVLSLDVEPRVRDALRERAAASGVSMAEYLANALAEPDRLFATPSASSAQALAQLSYEAERAREATVAADYAALISALDKMRSIIVEALRPLSRSHREEVHALDRRRAGGWSG